MGKYIPAYRNNDQQESMFRGCMWGIFYALDYHHWHNNVTKMLPRKRHNKRKNAKCKKNPKIIPGANGAAQKLINPEANHFLVNQPTTETSSTQKRSLKARIKALVAEKIRTEDDNKKRGSNFPALLQLERTVSVKHVESPNDDFNKTSNEWKSPIIFFPRKTAPGATKLQHPARMTANDWKKFDMCTKENLMEYIEHQKLSQNYTFSRTRDTSVDQARAKLLMQNASRCKIEEYADVLELFQVNEKLFQEFQQQRDVDKENRLHVPNESTAKARLTKSGTFPVANASYSRRRNFKPAKLKEKQTERWSFPGGLKLRNGPQDPEMDSEVNAHLEDERQRLETQNKVHTNEHNCTSNSFIDQAPDGGEPSGGGKHISRIYDTSRVDDDSRDLNSSVFTTDGSVYNPRSSNSRHRRTSSLNDSMHRYVRLCDYSFSMKSKSDLSKSVRLTNEYDILATKSAPISFKRNHSLPHGNSSWPLQDEESHDIFYPSVSSMTVMVGATATEDNNLSESEPVGLLETENLEMCSLSDVTEEKLPGETNVEKSKCSPEAELLDRLSMGINDCGFPNMDRCCEELIELTDVRSSSYDDLQVTCIEIDDKKVAQTSQAVLIRGRCLPQEFSSPANLVLEGSENTNNSHERGSPLHSFNSLDADFVSQSCSSETYLENPKTKNQIHTKLQTDDDADLNYAREILKVAGFNKNGFHEEWYLSEQPLSPLIFDEVEESWWPLGSECSQENLILLYHHQLLFDLINEVMLHIYETSFTYYPRALSTSCQVHPLHIANYEEEVLKSLSKHIVLKPELDQQLDDPVPRDLAKADGWMNLQMDSECVALELEDFIFDELLEELICS
ncbi:hypothetical protein POM88_050534 [Heracleum sosnowskyi]|uniref:DUF4378 domain-containing protein n=1 Tax=Heracleum sosnowskyi TaxID=360622 RepID=A0AAD8GZ19_9APIA|nr:hypothetical protein POM88_050534 [Heracleum sosnowskyi]